MTDRDYIDERVELFKIDVQTKINFLGKSRTALVLN